MNAKWTGLVLTAALGMLAANSLADERTVPAVRIAYIGLRDAKIKRTGDTITVAVFRMKNLTRQKVCFTLHGRKPATLIQRKTDAGWKTANSKLCGNGMALRAATLEQSASKTWYVDPAYYSGKYGQHLRIGVWVGVPNPDTDNERKTKRMIVWSDSIQFPTFDKPPEFEFSDALNREATQNNVLSLAPIPSKWRRCGIPFRKTR